MSPQPQRVRVTTGPGIASILVNFVCTVVVMAIKCAIELTRFAIRLASIIWVNVLVPGIRLAAQATVRLASTLARWSAERVGRSS